jgi:hypothetical protein
MKTIEESSPKRGQTVRITKSRAGHYTVTVSYCGFKVSRNKLASLTHARNIVSELRDEAVSVASKSGAS